MVKLIQDLTAFGPLLFVIVLITASFCAVWLIVGLHSGTPHRESVRFHLWNVKRSASRLKSLRHS